MTALYYRIAQALTQQGRTNEAIVAYREALRLVQLPGGRGGGCQTRTEINFRA